MTSFQFERVDLNAFRGFSGLGFKVEGLDPGLVVIHGPNGAGKSSLVQAMELLLWEQVQAPEATFVCARVRVGGQSQERERLQDRLVAKVGLQPAQASPWTGPATRDRYRLSLSDLLQAREANQVFSEQLRQEMQGGVDFPKHRGEVGAQTAFSRKAGLTAAYEEAWAAVEAKSKEQRDLESLEADIRRQGEEVATLGDQQAEERRLSALDQAMVSLETLLAAEAALTPFQQREALLAGLQEADDSRFQDLRKARDEAGAKAAGLRSQLTQLADQLVPLGLPADLGEEAAESARNLAGDLHDAEGEVGERGTALAAAVAALADWRQANPWLVDPESDLPALSRETLDRARSLARKFEQGRSLLHARAHLVDDLGPEEIPLPQESLSAATQILEQWQDQRATLDLQARLPDGKGRWGVLAWLLLGAGVLAGAVALLLARSTAPQAAAAVAAAILLLVLAARGLQTPSPRFADRDGLERGLAALQQQFDALRIPGFPAPAWTSADVAVLARRIRAAAASATGLTQLNETRRRAGAQLAAETAAWKRLLDEAGELARQLRLPAEGAEAFGGYLEVLGGSLQQGLTLRAALAAAGALELAGADRLQRLRAQADALLARCGRRPGADRVAELTVLARDLETALRLRHERDEVARALVSLESDAHGTALEAFLAGRRLEEHTFQEAWDTRQRWRPLLAAHATQRALAETLFLRDGQWTPELQAIADRSGSPLAERLERLDRVRTQLRDRLGAARQALLRLTAVRDDLLHKQATLDRLTREGTLATLILARDQAAQKLEEQRLRDLEGRTLARLIDRLERRGAEEDLKPQLRRASDLFQAFTQHRYTIRFENAAFVAREGGRTLALNQLSEGTRLQLLMAVRLAYVEHQEGADGTRLPLFLDEVLANSDDLRAQAIMEAIRVMSRTGRQIFYFTAQQDEVAKWRQLGPEGIQIIDLAEVRSLEASARTPLPGRDRTRPPVPAPGEDSLLAYARRLEGAAGPSLWTPLDRQHAWLAFGEGEQATLHLLLQGGLATLGQVKNYAETRTGAETESLLTTLAILAEAQTELRAVRPKPLPPEDLAGADIRGFGDLANVLAVLRECGHDPKLLLKTAIPGVGAAKRENLRDWLVRGGYVVEREESAEAILARLKGRYGSSLGLEAKGWLAVERFLSLEPLDPAPRQA